MSDQSQESTKEERMVQVVRLEENDVKLLLEGKHVDLVMGQMIVRLTLKKDVNFGNVVRLIKEIVNEKLGGF